MKSVFLFRWITDTGSGRDETIQVYKNFNEALLRFKEVQDDMINDWLDIEENTPYGFHKQEEYSDNSAWLEYSTLTEYESILIEEYLIL